MIVNIRTEHVFNNNLYYHSLKFNDTCNRCIKIEKVMQIKYLRIIISAKLNWKDHLTKKLYIAVRNFYFYTICVYKNSY